MNVLIIDDDSDKRTDITNQLLKLYPDARIRYFENYQDASRFISDNTQYIDLIMLDWSFPPDSYSRCKYGMGKQILTYMKYNNYNNKVIICSSDVVSINTSEFPFVLGTIVYSYFKTLEIMPLLNNKEESNGVVRTLKPKKPNTDSGYKRHKSSTPWWQQ